MIITYIYDPNHIQNFAACMTGDASGWANELCFGLSTADYSPSACVWIVPGMEG